MIAPAPLTLSRRVVVLVVAFLGWYFAGHHMAITQQTGQAAAVDLLGRTGTLDSDRYQALNQQLASKNALSADAQHQLREWKALVAQWFAWYQCAFLFGAATGGLLFGWLGDRLGRATAMALSIVTYAAFALVAAFTQSPWQLVTFWYLACLGVGGMWPNGVALVAETWEDLSRPAVAGVMGVSANVGIFVLTTVATQIPITPADWRWALFVGAAPLPLGLFALLFVPESPRWRAAQKERGVTPEAVRSTGEVFRPPLLWITLIGIVLATVPLVGGWGSANWMVPWAGEAGEAASPPDPYLKARVGQARALTGIVGSFLGGWMASLLGRRRSFFFISFCSLLIAQYTFWFSYPTESNFIFCVGILGFFSGLYFGWLPLFLPELFPTRVRSTGAGVSFNFGRIVTAITIFVTGALTQLFSGDYARIGQVTSLIFVLGMLVIFLAPDTSRKQLAD